jgi:transposase
VIPTPSKILFATSPLDFRKSIDSLAGFVEIHLREYPLSGTLFVFRNQRCNALKMLMWSQGGFILIYKRLEKGVFRFPSADGDRLPLSAAQIAAILEGLDIRETVQLPRWNPK